MQKHKWWITDFGQLCLCLWEQSGDEGGSIFIIIIIFTNIEYNVVLKYHGPDYKLLTNHYQLHSLCSSVCALISEMKHTQQLGMLMILLIILDFET
jgi:hypothetical protein